MEMGALVKKLAGGMSEFDFAGYDCYVRNQFGIFILNI